MKQTLKEYILLEKIQKQDYQQILKDKAHFKLGIEFEFYDHGLGEGDNSKEVEEKLDELKEVLIELEKDVGKAYEEWKNNHLEYIDDLKKGIESDDDLSDDEKEEKLEEVDELLFSLNHGETELEPHMELVDKYIDDRPTEYFAATEEDPYIVIPKIHDYFDDLEENGIEAEDISYEIDNLLLPFEKSADEVYDEIADVILTHYVPDNHFDEDMVDDYYENNDDFPIKDFKVGEYHENDNETTKWRIEPDASLESMPGGVEVISPPLPLDKGIQMMHKMIDYIMEHGETDKSTGLHINLSYKGMKVEKLDVLKMILFMEENRVHNTFQDREFNRYAESMNEILKHATKPNEIYQLTKGINKEKKKKFLKNLYLKKAKFNAMNIQDNRVEFRYLGGTDYETKANKIEQMILFFSYILKLGIDPSYKKDEYLRKLGKYLAKNRTDVKGKLNIAPKGMGDQYVVYTPKKPITILDHKHLVKGKPSQKQIKKVIYLIDYNNNAFGISDGTYIRKDNIIDSMTKSELDAKIKKMPNLYKKVGK